MEKLEGTKHIIYSGNRDIAEKVLRTMDKINEIVEWINTQQLKTDLQDQYKQ